jgi:hypothetical protein
VKKGTLTAALEKADLPAAAAALRHGDEVRGHAVVVKLLVTAFACYGLPRNLEEFQNPDGRYIVTLDGVIDGKFNSPCSSLRTPRTRSRAFVYSRARGRSSSPFGITWSATYALIRSPTPSGLFRQLHRQSEGEVLGCKRVWPNPALHRTGAAILVSHDSMVLQASPGR